MFLVAMTILITLWSCQVLFIGAFYRSVKTGELKEATNDIIHNLENENYEEIFDMIILQKDINIRIINTSDFANVYSGGDGFISATHDIGSFELMRLYDLAKENGGEISQYYTYDKTKGADSLPENDKLPGINASPKGTDEYMPSESNSRIGESFYRRNKPVSAIFFRNDRYVDDYLYAKTVTLHNGNELMVISDVQVTPLDSIVDVLKLQLITASLIALVLTLALSYIVSRYVAKPIEQLNSSAKELARGNFHTQFKGKGYREIEQLTDTLNYTASELDKVDKFRRELLANVSHDLRTPLTMIEGYAEVMRDIPGENTPENVQVIIDETQRLTAFVNNILDLSKLQSGIQSVKTERVNLTLLLKDIHERYVSLMKQDGYEISLDTDGEVFVMCDENKLSQALHNLIDNAINHTGTDKKVFIKQKTSDGKVRIEISDTGNGIPEDELPYIWDRYYRANSNHKRAIAGSGIGLSIVKNVFELHEVKYGVESAIGKGSTFWVEFNLSQTEKTPKKL